MRDVKEVSSIRGFTKQPMEEAEQVTAEPIKRARRGKARKKKASG